MNEKTVKHVADLIQNEVAYFNGLSVDKKSERQSCEIASRKIIKYLTKRCEKESREQTGITPTVGYEL